MNKPIYYGSHFISKKDISAVKHALTEQKITQGKNVRNFEIKLSNFFGSKYTSAVSSGTAALHLSMLSLNLKKSDTVITSPISFLASANCAEYIGCKVDFSDICDQTYNLDPNKLEDKLKKNKNIKVVIAIDYAGHPANWEDLSFLKRKYNFYLVNDNCHSLGSKYKNDQKYAVKFADIVTQSFHPVKHITTGEGGAVITNNFKIDKKIKLYRNHGIERNSINFKKFGMWYYKMNSLGYNYRISDINCALGISQLKQVKAIIEKRRYIAKQYYKIFKDNTDIRLPIEKNNCKHSYQLFPILVDFNKTKISKKDLFKKLSSKNIFLQVHYIPIHLQPYYKKKYDLGYGDFPIAEKFYKQQISLPIYNQLETKKLVWITNQIKNFLF